MEDHQIKAVRHMPHNYTQPRDDFLIFRDLGFIKNNDNMLSMLVAMFEEGQT